MTDGTIPLSEQPREAGATRGAEATTGSALSAVAAALALYALTEARAAREPAVDASGPWATAAELTALAEDLALTSAAQGSSELAAGLLAARVVALENSVAALEASAGGGGAPLEGVVPFIFRAVPSSTDSTTYAARNSASTGLTIVRTSSGGTGNIFRATFDVPRPNADYFVVLSGDFGSSVEPGFSVWNSTATSFDFQTRGSTTTRYPAINFLVLQQ